MAVWIAIEGIDGAGKRTQATLLRERLAAAGYRVGLLSFPRYGETVFARSVADYLNGKLGGLSEVDPRLAALLYAGDRGESRERLLATAAACDVLILDRYVASNLAYQGARVPPAARDAFFDWLTSIEHEAYGLPRADLTLLLDVPVRTASGLVLQKGERDYTDRRADIHEADQSYLATCRAVYHALAERQYGSRWAVIHCANAAGALAAADAIHERIWTAVAPCLPEVAGVRG